MLYMNTGGVKMDSSFSTRCVHGFKNNYDNTGAISVPIYQTATFAHEGLGESSGFDYSRLGNPTRQHLEKTVASLEGGLDAIAFSTGMAAISTLMELFQSGDHIIASEDLYGGSHRLFHLIAMKKGIEFDFVDTSNVTDVKALIRQETKAIYIETPTNPMMNVTDIEEIHKLMNQKDILLIVDNTFMTPYFQKPFQLGADIIIHSGTKYLGGHNDTLAGLLVVKNQQVLDSLRLIAKTLGAALSPFDSWLILKGIKTLPLRMRQQESTAKQLAKWLSKQDFVKKVYYVGQKDSKGYQIMLKQASGFGGMISFEVKSFAYVRAILNHVKVIQFAESLGGVESLITYPKTQTHADVPEEERNRKGINDCLLRFSVGIEDCDDLQHDIEQAIGEVKNYV